MSTPHVELELGEEDRAFLQQRVGLHAAISFGLVCLFLLFDLAGWLVLNRVVDLSAFWPHQWKGVAVEVVIAFGLLGSSLAVRRGRWGVIPLFAFDGAVTFFTCAAFAGLAHHAPTAALPMHLMIFLAIQTVLFVHAAVVPAPPIRTFLMHAFACAPLLYVAIERAAASPADGPLEKWGIPVSIATWALVFAAVSALLSRLLFRLRISVQKARRLGQYQLEQKLGEGGIGVVYQAKHALLRRPTAIKLLRREKVGENAIARFEREVRSTSRLTHPNTVAIYDYGRTPQGVFYYAMELLDGPNLAQVVGVNGPMPSARVIHVLRQCAGALAEAHEMGHVHRDVKPENIVLCRRGACRMSSRW